MIDAPVEPVWSVVSDVVSWPQWLPTVTAVETLDAPVLTVGARYRIYQPKLRPAVWTVVEVMQDSHFSWESRSPGVRALANHVLKRVSDHSTSALLQVEFSGPLSGLVGLLAGRLTREYIEREAASLKLRVESGVRPP